MAFFRNFSNDTVSPSALDENEAGQDDATFQSSPLNQDMGATYGERGFDMNMDIHYQPDAEPGCTIRSHNQTGAGNVAGPVDPQNQPPGRRMGLSGKWGSTFWKDCQPMGQREGSVSAKRSLSGYKDAEHSEDNLSNDPSERLDSENENEEDKAMNKQQSGQADVPSDEMLSDEYYEQDEDNQSDHVQYKAYGNATNSRSLPKTGSANKSRTSRAIQTKIHYGDGNDDDNGDADIDYEEEEDEDDPEDADFEPDDAAPGGDGRKKHDQAWDVSDEEPDSDDDFDLSDSEDDYETKKPKVRQQGKTFRKLSSGLDRKSAQASSRQKRKTSYQEDFSEDDSDNDIDEGFGSMTRRRTTLRNSERSTNNIGQSSEVRSSTRSVRKVSYVESEDSEDIDDVRNRKTQKDDIEEEDCDAIEKVLWHQPKGRSEDAHTNKKSTVPVLVSQLFDTEPDWNEMDFLIKWKGQSHLHCQWKSLSDLQNLSGFKKVLN